MAKTRRGYTGGAVSTTTTSSIAASGTTSFTVSAATGWPYGSEPYHVVLSPGTASEEKVLVTRTGSSDTTINIASNSERGQDGTSAVSHDSGATVFPVFTSVDADEANELTSTWTTKGDIVAHGSSTFTRLAVGTNEHVLKADSSTATGLAYGQVATAGIAADAIDGTKIADDAINSEHYVDGSIDTAHIADLQVTTAKIAADAVDGTKIADDSINSEHYVDGSIDTAHLADDAVTAAKIATGAVGADALAATAVTAATYGDADSVAQFTVDADGRLTAAANVDIVVPTSGIADDAVTQAKIGTGAVGNTELGADAVNGDKIADDAVASEHIANNAVALSTQTTGNYVATVSASDPLVVSGVGSEGATAALTMKVSYGKLTKTTSSEGFVTIGTSDHGLSSSNLTNAAIFITPRAEQSDDSDVLLQTTVTNISGADITFRVYEFDGGASSNSSANVSSVQSASVDVSYLIMYT